MIDTKNKTKWGRTAGAVAGILILLAEVLLATSLCSGATGPGIPSIFKPESTPADKIYGLSLMVLAITGIIFVIVFSLIAYAVTKFRGRSDDGPEPPQVYGSNQIELAWTVIPVLIVLVLFMAHDSRHPCHTGCPHAEGRRRGHRYRPSVLVGVSISRTGSGYC